MNKRPRDRVGTYFDNTLRHDIKPMIDHLAILEDAHENLVGVLEWIHAPWRLCCRRGY